MLSFNDHLGNEIKLNGPAKRIVSLVPSQTELLYDLGLDDAVVGITKFCIHPEEWFSCKPRVGGTKSVSIEKVKALNPDLIIANKEENTKEQIEVLQTVAPVWVSDVNSLDESTSMMLSVGELTGRSTEANRLVEMIKKKFDALARPNSNKSVLYLIWDDPIMCVGTNTFIDDMLNACGFTNEISDARYPELKGTEEPDLVFLSSEPFPFKEEHVDKYMKKFPRSKVVLVDGEMFSWYGSRSLKAVDYFCDLLNKLSL